MKHDKDFDELIQFVEKMYQDGEIQWEQNDMLNRMIINLQKQLQAEHEILEELNIEPDKLVEIQDMKDMMKVASSFANEYANSEISHASDMIENAYTRTFQQSNTAELGKNYTFAVLTYFQEETVSQINAVFQMSNLPIELDTSENAKEIEITITDPELAGKYPSFLKNAQSLNNILDDVLDDLHTAKEQENTTRKTA